MGTWSIKKTAADSAVTFDSLLGVQVLKATGVGMPPQANLTTPYGLTDGAFFQRTVVNQREFTLICGIPAETRASLHTIRKSLIAYTNRDRAATVQPCVIQYTEGAVTLEIDAYYDAGLEFGEVTGHVERVPLRFVAVNPFWRRSTLTTTTLSKGTTIPTAANTTVTNSGDANAWPQIQVTGPGQILQIKNSTINKTLSLAFTLVAGEVVTFDLRPGYKTVESNINGSLLGYLPVPGDLATWRLAPGANVISTAINNAGASAKILHYHSYWSIDGVA
jgi:hypothetical protein